jgi:hypothetical protein
MGLKHANLNPKIILKKKQSMLKKLYPVKEKM